MILPVTLFIFKWDQMNMFYFYPNELNEKYTKIMELALAFYLPLFILLLFYNIKLLNVIIFKMYSLLM